MPCVHCQTPASGTGTDSRYGASANARSAAPITPRTTTDTTTAVAYHTYSRTTPMLAARGKDDLPADVRLQIPCELARRVPVKAEDVREDEVRVAAATPAAEAAM